MDKDLFTLISHADERRQLFIDAEVSRAELMCKGTSEYAFRVRVFSFDDKAQSLYCDITGGSRLNEEEDCLVTLMLGDQKYYFRTNVTPLGTDKIKFQIPAEIYHLQCRQNYRVVLPANAQAFFKFVTFKGAPIQLQAKLLDISSGGCRVELDKPSIDFQIEDEIHGQLIIGTKVPIDVRGSIRHARITNNPHKKVIFGIQFTGMSQMLESKLFALSMEIHKQYFRKA